MNTDNQELWRRERHRMEDDLRNVDPSLGEAYSRVINLIDSYDSESNTAYVDIAVIGHLIRELMNTLPEFIGGFELPKPAQAQEQRAIDDLMKQIERNPLRSDAFDDGEVSVSSDLARACVGYYEARKRGTSNSRMRDAAAVLGERKPRDPSLTPWRAARDFFVDCAHFDRAFTKQPPSQDEVLMHLRRVEHVLTSRLGRFFEAKRQLVAIIDSANQKTADGYWRVPTDDDVLDALSLVNVPVLKSLFYASLENPKWAFALSKVKAFDNAPLEGEANQGDYWPESSYLARVATDVPDVVTSVMDRFPFSLGAAGKDAYIRIIEKLPAMHAAKLTPNVRRWMEDPNAVNTYWDEDSLVSIAVKLMEEEKTYREGKKLSYACLMPRDASESERFYKSSHAIVQEYEYGKVFYAMWSQLTNCDRRRMPEHLLGCYLKAMNYNGSSVEHSEIYIPSICDAVIAGDVRERKSMVHILVNALVAAISDNALFDYGQLELDLNSKKPIVVRCALYVLGELIRGNAPNTGQLCLLARRVCLSDAIYDAEYDVELITLAQIIAPYCDSSFSDGLFNAIKSAKSHLEPLYRSNLAPMFDDADALDGVIERRIRRWQHRRLSLLRTIMERSGGAVKMLAQLDEEFGLCDYQLKPFESRTIVGPNSPISFESMKEMSPDELLRHLGTWHPTDDDKWNLISHSGQAAIMKELVVANPFAFAGKIDGLKLLRPIYCRKVIEGLAEVLRDGRDAPIDDYIGLCLWASNLDINVTISAEGDEIDDDLSYRRLVLSSVYGVSEVLDSDNAGIAFSGRSEQVLRILLNGLAVGDPSEEYEDECSDDAIDPMGFTSNTIRPCAILGIARWADLFSDSPSVAAALNALTDYLPSHSDSIADAGAMGLAAPRLLHCNREWMELHYSDFFGLDVPNTCQRITLATVFLYYGESEYVLDCLRPAIDNALEFDCRGWIVGPKAFSKSCFERIGIWLYRGFVMSHLDEDDALLLKWGSIASSPEMWATTVQICSMMPHAENPSENVVERVGLLWDRCYQQCGVDSGCGEKAFSAVKRLAESGHYPNSWWAPRMRDCMVAEPGDYRLNAVIGKLLALSKDDPVLAFEILEAYVDSSRSTSFRRYTLEKIAVPLLFRAGQSANEEVRVRVSRCMNKLGAQGMVSLDDDVAEYMKREC